LFYHWQSDIDSGSATTARPPKNLALVFTDPDSFADQGCHDVLALGAEFATGNPVLAAQQIKNCIRDLDWIWLLRKCLYGEQSSKPIGHSPLIDRLSTLCANGCVQAVVNYNYDSVFEESLSVKAVRFTVLTDAQQAIKRGFLPVYHVHGYLKRGGGPKTRIVLAENDYHEDLVAPYSWSNLLQSSFLMRSTCVFIGTSMTDPNLRRLLRSAFAVAKRFHFAFLPSNSASLKGSMLDALFDTDLRALGVSSIRYPLGTAEDPQHSWLPRSVDWLLDQRKR
jgi:hypothetical protein